MSLQFWQCDPPLCHTDLTCRSPTKLGTIFLWLVPPHPPRCAGCSRRGASGVTCGAAPASLLGELLRHTLRLWPERPDPSCCCCCCCALRGAVPAWSCARVEPCPPCRPARCWRLLPGDRLRCGRRAPLDRSRPRGRSITARARRPWAALMYYS